ncbi:hypothetical protein [Natronococcus sp. A-GB7]|uniref:hypothetical protein n=1 Tax=Natronococcus sp. A-GB7 TaxID=3037649 RepID=UPI00241F5FD8|nr:hypothetical protein [Natronococcus sp. A-GB7]MDG5821891.1 hypothetical protein [Natronococcus sp. A-GB7]
MSGYEISQQEADESTISYLSTKDIAIDDTGAGFLVLGSRPHQVSRNEATTYQLICFANVTDRSVVLDAAHSRGYNDILSLPEIEIDKRVLMSFQAINRASEKEGDRNE